MTSTLIRQNSMSELRQPKKLPIKKLFDECLEEMEINTYDYVFRQGIKGWNKKHHQFLMLDLKAYMVKRFQGKAPHYSGNVYKKMWFSPVNFAKFPNYYYYPEEIKYGEQKGKLYMRAINSYTDEWIKYRRIPFIQEYYKEKTGQEIPTEKEYKDWGRIKLYPNDKTNHSTNFTQMFEDFSGERNVKSKKFCYSRRVVRRTLNYEPTPFKYASVLNYKKWDKTTKKTSLKGLKADTRYIWTEPKRDGEEGRARTGGWTFGGFDAVAIENNAVANGFKKVKGEKYTYGHYAEFLMKC